MVKRKVRATPAKVAQIAFRHTLTVLATLGGLYLTGVYARLHVFRAGWLKTSES